MKILCADLETDGLLAELTTIHQLSIGDVETREIVSFNDQPHAVADGRSIEAGLIRLREADRVVFHNGLAFDLKAVEKVRPQPALDWRKCIDTLVLSKLGRPERPGFKPHALATWGQRVGVDKPKHNDWTKWSYAMEDRCNADVEITLRVFDRLRPMLDLMPEACEIEHAAHWLISAAIARGFRLDVPYAQELASELLAEKEQAEGRLRDIFPPILVPAVGGDHVKTLKVINRRHALYGKATAPVDYCPVVVQEFNPGSGLQVANRLIRKYGWKPKQFTETGQPQVTEDTLKDLPWPEAEAVVNYQKAEKFHGMVGGSKGWLQFVDDGGRIHANLNPLGTVTGRPACSKPNLQQVPTDKRARLAFKPKPGRRLVGVDAEGLELRCLAHYLARYDGGEYAKEVVEGDIHTRVMDILGMRLSDDPEVVKKICRNHTKRFEYALIYGAGNAKLGLIMLQNAHDVGVEIDYAHLGLVSGKKRPSNTAVGEAARELIETKIIGLGDLVNSVKAKARRDGKLKGLDGRPLWVRSPHSALNLILQNAGIVVMKKALQISEDRLLRRGLRPDQDYWLVHWVHDEFQYEATYEAAELVGETVADCITEAGNLLGFRCPLAGAFQVGDSWQETH